MLNCANSWAPEENRSANKTFAPIVPICQSSGHCKTRSMKEFAGKHFTVYINLLLREIPNQNLSCKFLEKMNSQNDADIFILSLISTSLDYILE